MLTIPVYLDNHSTTRPDPRVVEAMLPYLTEHYGNAASLSHKYGWEAADAVELARERVAALIGAEPREVVFTSGATESNNLAIKGILNGQKQRGNHIVSAASEHRAVLDPIKRLGREGRDLTLIAPDSTGLITLDAIQSALQEQTVFVSIMGANNEVGTLNEVAEIGRLCRERGIVFHSDATQAVGKIPFDVREIAADLISFSAHKFHGPKGIGALFVSRRCKARIAPLFDGGGQEHGVRSGTLAVPLIVGFGKAAEIAMAEHAQDAERTQALRDRLFRALTASLRGITVNGHPTRRLPGNLNVSFAGIDGEALMMGLRDVAVSSGAACTSANPEPSHVLRSMGVDDELARASLRFGLSRFTTEEEVDFAAGRVVDVVNRLRSHGVLIDAPV